MAEHAARLERSAHAAGVITLGADDLMNSEPLRWVPHRHSLMFPFSFAVDVPLEHIAASEPDIPKILAFSQNQPSAVQTTRIARRAACRQTLPAWLYARLGYLRWRP